MAQIPQEWFTGMVRTIFRINHPRLVTFGNFEIALVLLKEFQNFQKCTWAIYPKSPSQTCDY